MQSVEQFLEQGSRVFRRKATDQAAVETHLGDSDNWRKKAVDKKESPNVRVDSAYDAVYLGALALLNMNGFVVTSERGHHAEPLEAACRILGASQGVFDRVTALKDARDHKYDGVKRTLADAEAGASVMEEFCVLLGAWMENNRNPKRQQR